jgi:hypothetical protein
MSAKLTFPNLTWVKITGNQNTFDALDFRDNGSLEFMGRSSEEVGVEMDLSSLPNQTTELFLRSINWSQKLA